MKYTDFSMYTGRKCEALKKQEVVVKTQNFILHNWSKLLLYFTAWCVIVLGAGAIYGGISPTGIINGFKVVSLRLAIGMSFGFAFGLICGIITVKVFDPDNQRKETNTPWGVLNSMIKKIDKKSVRPLMISVAVTLLLSAAVAYPYAIGAILGVGIMWQIVVKLYNETPIGSSSKLLKETSSDEEGDVTGHDAVAGETPSRDET